MTENQIGQADFCSTSSLSSELCATCAFIKDRRMQRITKSSVYFPTTKASGIKRMISYEIYNSSVPALGNLQMSVLRNL